MILNKVVIENIRSHEYTVFEPAEIGVTSISGENGAGKSTIVDSLAWSLFGTRLHNLKNKNYIREGVDARESKVQVTSYITVGNRQYKIRRRLTSNDGACECKVFAYNESTGEWDFETGPAVSHAESYIRTLLNCDEKGFLSSVFIQQKQVDQIVSASPRERGQVIEKLIGVSAITEGSALVREEARSLQKAAQIIQPGSLEDELAKVNNQKERTIEAQERYKNNKAELEKVTNELKEIKQKEEHETSIQNVKLSIENNISTIKSNNTILTNQLQQNIELVQHGVDENGQVYTKEIIEEELSELTSELKELQTKFTSLSVNKKELELLFSNKLDSEEVKGRYIQIDSELKNSIEELNDKKVLLAEMKNKISNSNKLLKSLNKGLASCPVCGHPITNTEAEVTKHTESLELLKSNKKDYEEIISNLEPHIQKMKNDLQNILENEVSILRKQEEKREEFAKVKKDFNLVEAELKTKQEIISIAQHKLSEVRANERSKALLESAKVQIDEIQKQLSSNKNKLSELELKLQNLEALSKSDYNNLLKELKNKESEVLQCQMRDSKFYNELILEKERAKIAVLDYKKCKKANEEYSELMNQILVMNLANENLSKFKEQRIKTSIPELTDIASDILSRFTDNKFTQLILTEKFETYVVTDNNIKRPVAQLSGGELSAAAIALRLAIALFLNNGGQHLLILDEVLTAMSADRSQLILETISSLTNAQIILIAHNEGINSFSDKVFSL